MSEKHYWNKEKAWIIFETLISIIIYLVAFRLFFFQITNSEEFPSDTPSHIRFALEGKGYSYLMPVIRWIMIITGKYGNIAVAVFEAFAILVTVYATKKTIMYCSIIPENVAFVISISLLFLSSLYIPMLQPLFYKSGIVSQPWHNITYIFMRLFAVLTIAGTWYIISKYQEHFTVKEWAFIAIPLCLSTAVKPSFLIGYSLALLLFLIIDVFKEKWSLHSIMQCIKMGTSVFPSLIVIYLQATGSLYKSGGGGIEISLISSGFFSLGLIGTIIKSLRGLLLVSLVVIYNRRKLIKEEWFIITQYLISLAVLILFHETGRRASHGNFAWGIYSAGYILMAFSWTKLAENYITARKNRKKLTARDKQYFIICGILSVWHVLSGIAYFAILSKVLPLSKTYLI